MKNYLYLLLVVGAFGCKVPYLPPVTSTPNSYLVVEGTINSGNGSADSTVITLSRTVSLKANDLLSPELHAQVSVEDGLGFSATLKEFGKGIYNAGPLGLDSTKTYRLRIKTAAGGVYLSDLSTVVYTPPIDSIGFTVNNDQITVYANAHNPANNTRYYRWDYGENWEWYAPYKSNYITNGKQIVLRDTAHQYPASCWSNDASTNIIVGSTEKLASDVVYQQPITYITGSSEKIEYKYSILLKQYGMTKDAYTFWLQEQKNTEQLGSIFDAQPSQINGNIHCMTNPAEPVFGYIGITHIQSKRVYILHTSLPAYFATYFPGCTLDSIYYQNPDALFRTDVPPTVSTVLVPLGSSLIPIDAMSNAKISYVKGYLQVVIDSGYTATALQCTNCALNGSTKRPSFWQGF